jgi:hypothetical protein
MDYISKNKEERERIEAYLLLNSESRISQGTRKVFHYRDLIVYLDVLPEEPERLRLRISGSNKSREAVLFLEIVNGSKIKLCNSDKERLEEMCKSDC